MVRWLWLMFSDEPAMLSEDHDRSAEKERKSICIENFRQTVELSADNVLYSEVTCV